MVTRIPLVFKSSVGSKSREFFSAQSGSTDADVLCLCLWKTQIRSQLSLGLLLWPWISPRCHAQSNNPARGVAVVLNSPGSVSVSAFQCKSVVLFRWIVALEARGRELGSAGTSFTAQKAPHPAGEWQQSPPCVSHTAMDQALSLVPSVGIRAGRLEQCSSSQRATAPSKAAEPAGCQEGLHLWVCFRNQWDGSCLQSWHKNIFLSGAWGNPALNPSYQTKFPERGNLLHWRQNFQSPSLWQIFCMKTAVLHTSLSLYLRMGVQSALNSEWTHFWCSECVQELRQQWHAIDNQL